MKMIIFDATKENIKEPLNWPQIPDHPYGILMIGGSESGKSNSLFILISHQLNIDLHAKDLYAAKYQLLINKQERAGLNHLNYSKAMDDTYNNTEVYNPNKQLKILISFDDDC